MAATEEQRPWNFDVASLMVLISEGDEEAYRLSHRSWLECLVTAPVVGVQNYIRPYDFLLDAAKLDYFSPDGVKSAPLRYSPLCNAIKAQSLLADARYTVYRIPDSSLPPTRPHTPRRLKYDVLMLLWVAFTWLAFAGLVVFALRTPDTTWIGIANCVAFTGWSLVLRVVERLHVRPATVRDRDIALPKEDDAVFVLGRNNAAFVLEGSRRDVKRWTGRGLCYRRAPLGVPAAAWQWFTRLGSLLALLFIFSSIPNGSTADQVVFILLNGLAQVNVVAGRWLNSARLVAGLELVARESPQTRTEVYGYLVRRYKDLEARKGWVDASGMLPKTSVWERWLEETLMDDGRDVKEIYTREAEKQRIPSVVPVTSAGLP